MFSKIDKDIAKTGISILLDEPFYGHLFSHLGRKIQPSEGVSLMVAGRQPILVVDPDFWDSLDEPIKYGYVKHQLLHLALGHPFRRKDFQHQHVFDIAADLVVNQYIAERHLPGKAITLGSHPLFVKWEKGMDVGYYYHKILEGQKQKDKNSPELPPPNDSHLRQHNNWQSFDELDAAQQRVMEDSLQNNIVQSAERTEEKLQGSIPGNLLRLIKEFKKGKNKKLDWRRVLRLFVGTGNKTFVKNTIRRPSKRYGSTPGTQIKKKQRLLVAIDTSGSVGPEEIQLFFNEINRIHRQGAVIHIVEADAEIQQTYFYNGQVPKEVKGTGGTDFNPVINYANRIFKPNAIIYFTDGMGLVPEIVPAVPMLWLFSSEGIKYSNSDWNKFPGIKIKM